MQGFTFFCRMFCCFVEEQHRVKYQKFSKFSNCALELQHRKFSQKRGQKAVLLGSSKKKSQFFGLSNFLQYLQEFLCYAASSTYFVKSISKCHEFFFSIFSKMDQQYCLKWNHHQSNLLKVFSRLLGNEQFTDVLLATESKSIRCHKVVLSACSSYFEHLFLTFDEKNQIIILKDTSYDDILALVEFMYRGEINVGQVSYNKLIA